MNPLVRREVYEEAVEAGRIDKVRLIKVERPNDLAVQATRKWVRGGTYGKLELDISASTRGAHLKADLLRRFFRGQQQVVGEILEFEGLEFDRAKVEVELEDGTRRTFNLEDPSSGHPMTLELDDLDLDDEGNPTIESVFAGLRGALDELE